MRTSLRSLGRFPMTVLLLVLIVGVWSLMRFPSGFDADSLQTLVNWGAASRPALFDGEEWRLFIASFLHLGVVHLAANGLSLWSVGRAVEYLLGPVRMLYVFLVAGIVAMATSAVFGPPVVVTVGASGAIMGLLGAVIWYRIASPLGSRISWRPLLISLLINVGIGLSLSQFIDNWNHLGGFVGGGLAAAAVGFPPQDGQDRGWWRPAPALQRVLAGILAALTAAIPLGLIPLPGLGHSLANALIALEAGRPNEAVHPIRQALERQPDVVPLRVALVESLIGAGRCTEARQEWAVLSRQNPDPEETQDLPDRVSRCRPTPQ